MTAVTRILERVEHGDAKAAEELLPLVYDQLRQQDARNQASWTSAVGCNMCPGAPPGIL